MSPLVAQSIALQLSVLRGLARWEPVARLAASFAEALSGGEGVTQWDLRRLSRWAAVWTGLRPEVRAFYEAALAEYGPNDRELASISTGLYSLLERASCPGWARGTLRRIYADQHGHTPAFDLA